MKVFFVPRDATQSALMPQYVVRPSVCLWRSGSLCFSDFRTGWIGVGILRR